MTIFDQKGQTVTNQVNVGHLTIGQVTDFTSLRDEVEKIIKAVQVAANQKELSEEASIDVEGELKKVIVETKKENPDKSLITKYLSKAKSIIPSALSAAKSVSDAIVVIERISS